ncbi:MAG: hypothetical protein KGR98_06595 [Verrucomicrobia bacterium]|nr:hypothetical protein [Verrucomicrobiota bacterium]MDE3099138.1 hypothetical protein [Verrucomicrobiota bacterium]
MKTRNSGWAAPVAACACALGLGLTLAQAQPTAAKAPVKQDQCKTAASGQGACKKSGVKKSDPPPLTGAELYQIHCNRCHPERYPTEFTAGQWQTIMLHMQVRANLPPPQAKKILKYLQEDSGK